MMRGLFISGLSFAILLALAIAVLCREAWILQSNRDGRMHLVLVGASIGQGWHLAGWPRRVGAAGFSAEALAAWSFDKTEVLEDMLLRPRVRFRPNRHWLVSILRPPRRPDVVILKECSSYFPGNLVGYSESIRKWTDRLQGGGIRVVLATVVPVTRRRAEASPGKLGDILAYNRWLRQFARDRGIAVLDLEAALRDPDSYLPEDYAQEDGSHLNALAYASLDRCLLDFVSSYHPSRHGLFEAASGPAR
jgi:hypothetical protein